MPKNNKQKNVFSSSGIMSWSDLGLDPSTQYTPQLGAQENIVPTETENDPGFIEKWGRKVGRGLGTALQVPYDVVDAWKMRQRYSEDASPLYAYDEKTGAYGREDTTGPGSYFNAPAEVMKGAIETLNKKGQVIQDRNVDLSTGKEGLVERSALSMGESMPESLAYMGLNMIPGMAPVSFAAMSMAETARSFRELTAELDKKGIKYDPKEVYKIAEKMGLSEGVTEELSDLATLGAAKVFTRSAKKVAMDTAKKELIDRLFKVQFKEGMKAIPKTLAASGIGEAGSEVANLDIKENLRTQLGLENRFKDQWAETALSALMQSGVMTSTAHTYESRQAAKQSSKVKDFIFSGIENPEKLTDTQAQAYYDDRVKLAKSLYPEIKDNLGEEAANNFLKNVENAAATAVNPNVEDKGELPYNESIFDKEPSHALTVPATGSTDVDTQGVKPKAPSVFDAAGVNRAIQDENKEAEANQRAIPSALAQGYGPETSDMGINPSDLQGRGTQAAVGGGPIVTEEVNNPSPYGKPMYGPGSTAQENLNRIDQERQQAAQAQQEQQAQEQQAAQQEAIAQQQREQFSNLAPEKRLNALTPHKVKLEASLNQALLAGDKVAVKDIKNQLKDVNDLIKIANNQIKETEKVNKEQAKQAAALEKAKAAQPAPQVVEPQVAIPLAEKQPFTGVQREEMQGVQRTPMERTTAPTVQRAGLQRTTFNEATAPQVEQAMPTAPTPEEVAQQQAAAEQAAQDIARTRLVDKVSVGNLSYLFKHKNDGSVDVKVNDSMSKSSFTRNMSPTQALELQTKAQGKNIKEAEKTAKTKEKQAAPAPKQVKKVEKVEKATTATKEVVAKETVAPKEEKKTEPKKPTKKSEKEAEVSKAKEEPKKQVETKQEAKPKKVETKEVVEHEMGFEDAAKELAAMPQNTKTKDTFAKLYKSIKEKTGFSDERMLEVVARANEIIASRENLTAIEQEMQAEEEAATAKKKPAKQKKLAKVVVPAAVKATVIKLNEKLKEMRKLDETNEGVSQDEVDSFFGALNELMFSNQAQIEHNKLLRDLYNSALEFSIVRGQKPHTKAYHRINAIQKYLNNVLVAAHAVSNATTRDTVIRDIVSYLKAMPKKTASVNMFKNMKVSDAELKAFTSDLDSREITDYASDTKIRMVMKRRLKLDTNAKLEQYKADNREAYNSKYEEVKKELIKHLYMDYKITEHILYDEKGNRRAGLSQTTMDFIDRLQFSPKERAVSMEDELAAVKTLRESLAKQQKTQQSTEKLKKGRNAVLDVIDTFKDNAKELSSKLIDIYNKSEDVTLRNILDNFTGRTLTKEEIKTLEAQIVNATDIKMDTSVDTQTSKIQQEGGVGARYANENVVHYNDVEEYIAKNDIPPKIAIELRRRYYQNRVLNKVTFSAFLNATQEQREQLAREGKLTSSWIEAMMENGDPNARAYVRKQAAKARLESMKLKQKQRMIEQEASKQSVIDGLEEQIKDPKAFLSYVFNAAQTLTNRVVGDSYMPFNWRMEHGGGIKLIFPISASNVKSFNLKVGDVQASLQEFVNQKHGRLLQKFNKKELMAHAKKNKDGSIDIWVTEKGKRAPVRYSKVNNQSGIEKLFNVQTRDGKVVSNAGSEYTAFLKGDQSVGSTRAIPKEAKGFIDQISKWFKLQDKIFILTKSDVHSSNLADMSVAVRNIKNATGDFVGQYYATEDGVGFLVLNDNVIKDKKTLLRTLSHEVGHAIISEHYNNASDSTKEAIWNDFSKWLRKMEAGGDERAKAIRELYQEGRLVSEAAFAEHYSDYLDSNGNVAKNMVDAMFEEYLAEQTGKFIRERQSQAEGAITKFFSDLANKIRKIFSFYNKASLELRQPVPSIAAWLDGVLESQRVERAIQERDKRVINYYDEYDKLKYEYDSRRYNSLNEEEYDSLRNKFKNDVYALREKYSMTDDDFFAGRYVDYANLSLEGYRQDSFNILLNASGEYVNNIYGSDHLNIEEYGGIGVPNAHFGFGNWAHIRGDIRETTTGKKVLNISELQSDWDKKYTKSTGNKVNFRTLKELIETRDSAYIKYDEYIIEAEHLINELYHTGVPTSVLDKTYTHQNGIVAGLLSMEFSQNDMLTLLDKFKIWQDEYNHFLRYNGMNNVNAKREFRKDLADRYPELQYNKANFAIYPEIPKNAKEIQYKKAMDFINKFDFEGYQNNEDTLQEVLGDLDDFHNTVAPPPIEGKYWMQHAIKQIIRYANEKGINLITFPSTAQQIAEIENWHFMKYYDANGKVLDFLGGKYYEDGYANVESKGGPVKYVVNGQDMTSIIDRVLNKVPAELKRLVKSYGGKVGQVQVEDYVLNAIQTTPTMVKEVKKFGPKFSKIQPEIRNNSGTEQFTLSLAKLVKGVKAFGSYLDMVTPLTKKYEFNKIKFEEYGKNLGMGMNKEDALNAAIETATEKSGIVVARVLEEQHIMESEKAKHVNRMMFDENGVNVFDDAKEAYGLLAKDEQRMAVHDLLYSGDYARKVFNNIDETQKATKYKVTPEIFDAYQKMYTAIKNTHKQSYLASYLQALDTVVQDLSDRSLVNKAKTVITSELNKRYGRIAKRMESIRRRLINEGLSVKQTEDILSALGGKETGSQTLEKELRRTLRMYVSGGIEGAVYRERPSMKTHPYFLRIYSVTTDANDIKTMREKYMAMFKSAEERDLQQKKIEEDLSNLQKLFPYETIDLKDYTRDGQLMITPGKFTEQEWINNFGNNADSIAIQEGLLTRVLEDTANMKNMSDSDISSLKRSVIGQFARKQLAKSNRYAMRRKAHNIEGYLRINPLEAAFRAIEANSARLARINYMNRMLDYIAGVKNAEKQGEAIEEFRNSLKIADKYVSAFSNNISVLMMAGKVKTALTQSVQLFTSGVSEMRLLGIPTYKSIPLLVKNYVKLMFERAAAVSDDFRHYLMSDKFWGNLLRKHTSPYMYNIFMKTLKDFGTGKLRAEFNDDVRSFLEERRSNRDTLDTIMSEVNHLEASMSGGMRSTTGKAYDFIKKAGMLLFNEMEVLNRETALVSMYEALRNKGESREVAGEKSLAYMYDVNADFAKYNKVKMARKFKNSGLFFSLTSFVFHTIGRLQLYTKTAIKGETIQERINGSLALLSFMLLLSSFGGYDSLPGVKQFNQLATEFFGRDYKLQVEKWARGKADNAFELWALDAMKRGLIPKIAGVDWSSSLAVNVPFLELLNKEPQSISKMGAGGGFITSMTKATRNMFDGDFMKAIESSNLGPFPDIIAAKRMQKHGLTTKEGAPQLYAGKRVGKLNDVDTFKRTMGFKTPEMAHIQEVLNSERVVTSYWIDQRKSAVKDIMKIANPYLIEGKNIPKDEYNDILKIQRDFNKSLLKTDKEVRFKVKPIDDNTIQGAIKNRYTPNSGSAYYQNTFTK